MINAELCDVCGGEVDPSEAQRAELSVGSMMCPTAMVFHPACYEQASDLWQPDPDSTCTVDPAFPESGRWVEAQRSLDRQG
ncbi:MAG: hypothetical protein ACRDZ9_05030 [Acidimicrobiales bacterium]